MADESSDLHENDIVGADDRDIDDASDDDTASDADGAAVATEDLSSSSDDPEPDDADDSESHLANVPDGAGCTEIWEHVSAGRDNQ